MEACYRKTKRDEEEKGAQKRGGSKKAQRRPAKPFPSTA